MGRKSLLIWILVFGITFYVVVVYLQHFRIFLTNKKPLAFLLSEETNITWVNITEALLVPSMVEMEPKHMVISQKHSIAIGCAYKTPERNPQQSLLQFIYNLDVFQMFLPSFCEQSSAGFAYYFYITYDFSDHCLSDVICNTIFSKMFRNALEKCTQQKKYASSYHLTAWSVPYQGKPGWAQNDAMMRAYVQGFVEYFYRVNDDTRFNTPRWTEKFIEALEEMEPRRVGVTGPQHHGGKLDILTYDFVHRTHIDVFGFYYPRIFGTWYNDGWITYLYSPNHIEVLKEVSVTHKAHDSRYQPDVSQRQQLNVTVAESKLILNRYIEVQQKHHSADGVQGDSIIVFCINSVNINELAGVLRNVHLAKSFLPSWSVRVYFMATEGNNNSNSSDKRTTTSDLDNVHIRSMYIRHIVNHGAHVFVQNHRTSSSATDVGAHVIKHILKDRTVSRFIYRPAEFRLSFEESVEVHKWRSSNTGLLCITDTNTEGCLLAVNKLRTSTTLDIELTALLGSKRRSHQLSGYAKQAATYVQVNGSGLICDQFEQCS